MRRCVFAIVSLLLSHLTITATEDSFNVLCTDEKSKMSQANALCKAQIAHRTPWTDDNSTTAPVPDNLTATIMNRSGHIGIRIRWRQKAVHLQQKIVKGYHLEITPLQPPGASMQYIFNWSGTFLETLKSRKEPYVDFKYECCGKPGELDFMPRNDVFLKIQAMPMYRAADKPLSERLDVKIPGCKKLKEMGEINECVDRRTNRKNQHKKKNRVREKTNVAETLTKSSKTSLQQGLSESGNNSTSYVVLGSVLGVLLTVCFIIIIIFLVRCRLVKSRNKRDNESKHDRSVVLICSDNERFLTANNFLVELLKKCENLELIVNIRQKVEIGKEGIATWAENCISEADVVIFLPVNSQEIIDQEKDDLEGQDYNRQMKCAFKVAKNIALTTKISNTKTKFLVVDMNDCLKPGQVTFCQYYKLGAHFKKLMSHVHGNKGYKVEERSKTIFLNHLSNAQLGYQPVMISSSRDDEISSEKQRHIENGQNDLNYSHLNSITNTGGGEGQLNSFNIVLEGHPSFDSNPSLPYVTTDFNPVDPNEPVSDRYHRTGARPKIT